ncbi:hypothetical protein DFJ77DRAFT_439351 [Powellomyces hirtus]|nr:hypothetical protein DFJ77DRAFT_439351 [Powellomyces hirtus]
MGEVKSIRRREDDDGGGDDDGTVISPLWKRYKERDMDMWVSMIGGHMVKAYGRSLSVETTTEEERAACERYRYSRYVVVSRQSQENACEFVLFCLAGQQGTSPLIQQGHSFVQSYIRKGSMRAESRETVSSDLSCTDLEVPNIGISRRKAAVC